MRWFKHYNLLGLDRISNNNYNYFKKHSLIDWKQYQQDYCPGNNPVKHYLNTWQTLKPVFPGFFDTDLYLYLYPDVAKTGINPLLHFTQYGLDEGRAGWLEKRDFIESGTREYNPNKKTIFLVSHDCSFTGAPVVALKVAEAMNTNFNVIVVLLAGNSHGGSLHQEFLNVCFLQVKNPNMQKLASVQFVIHEILKDYDIAAVILNSVESLPFLQGTYLHNLPSVSLIHEYPDYTRPRGKIALTVIYSDIVIILSNATKRSALNECKLIYGINNEPSNIRIQPQGNIVYPPQQVAGEIFENKSLRDYLNIDSDDILIAGSGYVDQRKGVDWFLQTFIYLRQLLENVEKKLENRLKFVWLGDGLNYDSDYTIWLKLFMEINGLQNQCFFPGHTTAINEAVKEIDVFLLTSRLDPFPNVVIDAMSADCGIACFSDGSGIAEFMAENHARAVFAPYGDVHRMAEVIVENLDYLMVKDGVNSSICSEKLKFEDYTNTIFTAIEEAVERQKSIQSIINGCKSFNNRFNSNFYKIKYLNDDTKKHFLSLLIKDIVIAKPFPGSDIQVNREKYLQKPQDSFLDYINMLFDENEKQKNNLVVIDGMPGNTYQGEIAIHFHIYYHDLINEYCDYFEKLKNYDVDLFITHISDLEKTEVKHLEESISGNIFFHKLPNYGRNVYPFYKILPELINNKYDIVGHFHTKKTEHFEAEIGRKWRSYLLENLIGTEASIDQILSIFNSPDIGLVFAEDSCCIGEAENREEIAKLSDYLSIPEQEFYFSFPLGTMFWARVDALAPLTHLDQNIFKLSEPIPYDGTILHAFERVLPVLIEESGYVNKLIYRPNTSR